MARLKALPIVNPKTNQAVAPAEKTVIENLPAAVRPIFVYVKVKSLEKPEVKEFIEFYMKNAPS